MPVDPVLLHAMSWAAELGVTAVAPEAGAVLRLLAGTVRARTAVEIGTGTGVSGLWLLPGMRPDGVLTSIDIDADLQSLARQSFAAAGYPPGRSRLIAGTARDVLPRLADGAYDLVFVDVPPTEHATCVAAAHRLLRDGGVLVVTDAADDTGGPRPVAVDLRDAPGWIPALVPAGAGLLCAARRVG